MSMTRPEMKNWVDADDVSALSESLRVAKMPSSFVTLLSIIAALSCKPVILRSTRRRVWFAERQNGRKRFSMW
jgi:hypothetical protein